jgi:HSP20 family protein
MSNIRVINPWGMLPSMWEDVSDMTNRVLGVVPAINVYEKDELVHVEMEVPGYTTENLDISITGDILKVTGKSSEGSEHKQGRRYYVSEISEKSFTRTITLPYEVIAEEAKAEFRNGMLTLVLPKSEKAKPKTIKISAE